MTRRTGVVVAAGLLLAVLLAGVVSSWASDAPDGLEQVATEQVLVVDTPRDRVLGRVEQQRPDERCA